MTKKAVIASRREFRAKAFASLNLLHSTYGKEQRQSLRKMFDQEWHVEHDRYMGVSTEVPGKVAYARSSGIRYDEKRRTRTTLGKYIAKFHPWLHGKIGHSGVDRFCAMFATQISGDLSSFIEVLEGDDITRAYRDCVGSNSCMTGSASEYTEIYAANPDKVKLAVCNFNNSQTRALVWTLEDVTLVDRCYPNHSLGAQIIRQWAKSKKYVNRVNDEAAFPGFDDGKTYTIEDLKMPDSGFMPYMDTFFYGKLDDDNVTISTECPRGFTSLDSQSGGPWGRAYTCDACEDRVRDGDAYHHGDYTYCEDCYNERISGCGYCSSHCHRDEMHTVNVTRGGYTSEQLYCQRCFDLACSTCDDCHEAYPTDTSERRADTGGRICPVCADELTCCETCDEFTDSPEDVANGTHCSGCAEDVRERNSEETGASV